MSFDWQTEDLDWDSKPSETASADYRRPNGAALAEAPADDDEQPRPRRNRHRAALYAAGVAGLLLALAAVVYWQLQRRIEATERRLTAEVNASHDIIMRATAEGDAELLLSFLSGRDRQWTEAQEELVRGGGFVDRSTFGLTWTEEPSAATLITPTATLAPDLRSAELVVPRDYVLDIGRGLTETVTLAQTLVFRPGADRWLLSPPEPEFWGETEMVIWRHIEMTYPARDAATAERLARDLNAALADLCANLEGDCARLTVNLSTAPGDLSAYDDPMRYLQGGSEVVLPAPTLFGAPVDEAGYRALYRAYAARVVGAAAANYAGWTCCSDALFYTVLLEAQLHRLGLRSWPVTAEAFAELVAEPSAMAAAEAGWRYNLPASVADGAPAVYALVDFLVEEAGAMPILEMQRALLDYTNRDYWGWLSRVTGGAYATQADFEREWLRYAVERHDAARAISVPPAPWPAEALQLICRRPGASRAALYRYNLSDESLRRERDLEPVEDPILVGLPGRDGVVVASRNDEGRGRLPFIWRDGRTTPITFGEGSGPALIPLPPSVGSESLLFFLNSLSATPLYALLSPSRCASRAECAAEARPGMPTISPDGRLTLLAVGEPTPLSDDRHQPLPLYLGDSKGTTESYLGRGWSPFWLDEDTFGYVAPQPDADGQRVILRDAPPALMGEPGSPSTTPPPKRRIVLSSDDLRRFDGVNGSAAVVIDRVLPSSIDDDLFIIITNPFRTDELSLVIVYNLSRRELSPGFSFTGRPLAYRSSYGFSPDGRWLVVSVFQTPAGVGRAAVWDVYLHAVLTPATGRATRVYTVRADNSWPALWLLDWSADGQWLALVTDGYVRLIAPNHDYSAPLILPDLACTAAAWVS